MKLKIILLIFSCFSLISCTQYNFKFEVTYTNGSKDTVNIKGTDYYFEDGELSHLHSPDGEGRIFGVRKYKLLQRTKL